MNPMGWSRACVHTGACRRHCYLLDFVYQEQNQRARSKHDTLLVFLLAEFRNHDRGRRRRRCFLLVADEPEGDRDQCNTMRLLTFFRTHDVASCGELPAAFGAAEQQPDGEGFVMGSLQPGSVYGQPDGSMEWRIGGRRMMAEREIRGPFP